MAGTKQIGEAIVAAIRSIEANGDRISKSELIHAIDVSMRGVLPKWNSSIFLRMCNVAPTQEQIEQVRIYYEQEVPPPRIVDRFWNNALEGMQAAVEPSPASYDDQLAAMAMTIHTLQREGRLEEANRTHAIYQQMREEREPQMAAVAPTFSRDWFDAAQSLRTQRVTPTPAPRVEVIVCEMCQIGFLNTDIRICPHCSNPYCLGCLAEHDRERS